MPTPNPLNEAVGVVAPPTVPVPVKMLQLPVPMLIGEAVAVVTGDNAHKVWFNGLITAGLVIGSTLIVKVALVPGQEPTLVTLYWAMLVPTPKDNKLVVCAAGLFTVPVGVSKLQAPVPIVIGEAVTVVLGAKPHKV